MDPDASPVAVALRMLEHRFGTVTPTSASDDGLADFQADAVARLTTIIERRGGALLADSVGLGKTHVAVALIRQRIAAGGAVLVSGPAALAAQWRRHLRRVHGWRWVSHTSMSRSGAPALLASAVRALVVVDEAHAFRNPASRRHRALLRVCASADVLLLSATPVNNSLRDFLHLLRLFARDDAFADIGVPSLLGAVELAEAGSTGALRRITGDVMVRRTRELLRTYHPVAPVRGTSAVRFPDREPVRWVHYDLDACYGGITTRLADALSGLRFAAHHVSAETPTELLRLGLLKRLESSVPAFAASLQGHRRILHEFVAAAEEGYLLDVHTARRLLPDVDGSVQLPMRGVALRRWPSALDQRATLRAARHDLRIIDELLACVHAAPHDDPKIRALHQLAIDELADETVLVFTEFRHTAFALWSALRLAGGVALVTGSGARLGAAPASPAAVLRRFTSPASVPPHQRVRVLIATDVLAEGLNLQVARVVVGFDMPWNPVRLAQRIGRVDRLGSPHASVLPVVFAPDAGVETLLRIMRRVRRKLRQIRVVGGDTPWQPARVLADGDVAEALRLEYGRLGGSPDTPAASAAVHWREDRGGGLVCVTDGAGVWLVLVRDGARRPEVDSLAADELLLAVLRGDLPPAPASAESAAWRARLSRRALSAVRRARQRPVRAGRAPPAIGRAAALVHRWLREHGDACASADWAAGEAVLAWLRDGASVRESLVGELVQGGDPATAFARLRAACARDSSGASGQAASAEVPGRPLPAVGRLRVVAMLELVPTASVPAPR